MKLIESELVLEDFFIVKSNYAFNEPENNNNIKNLIKDYQIDIDFIVRDIEEEEDKYIIFIKVDINNQDEKLPGYSLFAEGVAIFSFDPDSKLNEKEKSDFLWVSGVSISINSLRSFLSTFTSYFPLGKYNLPSVDLTTLLNTKRKALNKKKS
jgi:hypothetical protein